MGAINDFFERIKNATTRTEKNTSSGATGLNTDANNLAGVNYQRVSTGTPKVSTQKSEVTDYNLAGVNNIRNAGGTPAKQTTRNNDVYTSRTDKIGSSNPYLAKAQLTDKKVSSSLSSMADSSSKKANKVLNDVSSFLNSAKDEAQKNQDYYASKRQERFLESREKAYQEQETKRNELMAQTTQQDISKFYDLNNNPIDYDGEIKNLNGKKATLENVIQNPENETQKTSAQAELDDVLKQLNELSLLKDKRDAFEEDSNLRYLKEIGDEQGYNSYREAVSHKDDTFFQRLGRIPASLLSQTLNEIPMVATQFGTASRINTASASLSELKQEYEKGNIDNETYVRALSYVDDSIKRAEQNYNDSTSVKLRGYINDYRNATYYGTEGLERFLLQTGESTAQFLLHYAIGTGFASAGLGATAGMETVREVGGGIATLTMSGLSATEKTNQLLEQGYDFNTAYSNGLLTGLLSYMTEKVGMDAFVETLGTKVSVDILGEIIRTRMVSGFLAEGGEEFVEGLIEPVIDSFTLGTPIEVNGNELLMSFLMGGVSGGLMSGGGVMVNSLVQVNDINKQLNARRETRQLIIKTRQQYNQVEAEMELLKRNLPTMTDTQKSIYNEVNQMAEEAKTAFEQNSTTMAVTFSSDNVENFSEEENNKTILDSMGPAYDAEVENIKALDGLQSQVNADMDQIIETEDAITAKTQEMLNENGYNIDAQVFSKLDEKGQNDALVALDFARTMGINVNVTNDTGIRDAILQYGFNGTQEQLQKIIDGANGLVTEDGNIFINGSKRPILFTLAHELTHGTESSKYYPVLRDMVKSSYGKDWQKAIDQKAKDYEGIANFDAEKEVVARYVEDFLGDEQFIDNLIKYNYSLASRIYQNLQAFGNNDETIKIRNAFEKAFRDAQINNYQNENVQLSKNKLRNTQEMLDLGVNLDNKLVLKSVGDSSDYFNGNVTSISDIAHKGLNNINKTFNSNRVAIIDSNGARVRCNTEGLKHGILNLKSPSGQASAFVVEHADVALKNAQKINELNPSPKHPNGQDVYLSIVFDDDGNAYPTRIIVDKSSSQLEDMSIIDKLYASKSFKKEVASLMGPFKNGTTSNAILSDLVYLVKDKYAEILPQSILEELNIQKPNNALSNNTKLSFDSQNVNTQAQLHKDRALEEYGITNDPFLAGYLMDDGQYLDFSEGQGYRVQDHRNVGFVFDDYNPATDGMSKGMIRFMNEGNIRIQPESNGIDISDVNEPTSQQYNSLYDYFDMLSDTGFRIDMSNEEGRNVFSIDYPPNTSPRKAINDIKQYFEDGTIPEVNNPSNYFRYSFGENTDKNANRDSDGEKVSEKDIQYFKGTKLTDGNGNLLRIYHTSPALFTEFNPTESDYYRFGDKVVNYYSTDSVVSGSYTEGNYSQVQTGKDIDTIISNSEKRLELQKEIKQLGKEFDDFEAEKGDEILNIVKNGNLNNALEEVLRNFNNYEIPKDRGIILGYGSNHNENFHENVGTRVMNIIGQGRNDGIGFASNVLKLYDDLSDGKYMDWELSQDFIDLFEPLFNAYEDVNEIRKTQNEIVEKYREIYSQRRALEEEENNYKNAYGKQYVGYGKALNPYILQNDSGYRANWDSINDLQYGIPQETFDEITDDVINFISNSNDEDIRTLKTTNRVNRFILNNSSKSVREYLMNNPIVLANVSKAIAMEKETYDKYSDPYVFADAVESRLNMQGQFNSWNGFTKFNNRLETNDVVHAVLAINDYIDTPYDGIIFRGITDSGSDTAINIPSDIIALFDSNQFKLIGNENPTDNPDIRYSIGLTNDKQNNNVKKEDTDDFKLLQSESERIANTTSWGDKSRIADAKLQQRLSQVFRMELESRDYSPSNADGLLKDTGDYKIYKDVDGQTFHDIFSIARTYLNKGELVDLHPVDTTEHDGWTETGYNDTRNFLSEDGLSGFAITKDGDLISVFNLSDKGGFLRSIAPFIKENAKTLDCYVLPEGVSKTNLQDIYNKAFGFETTNVEDYNWDYDHDGIGDRYKEPKIAYMVNPNYSEDTQKSAQEDKQRQQRFPENLEKSQVLNEEQKEDLRERVANNEFTYTGLNNQEEVNKARDNMFKAGVDDYFKGYMNNNSPSAKTVVQGEVLLTELAKNNDSRWEQVASKLADDATVAGQFLQAYAIMQRLTPEGQLVTIRRNLNRMQRDIDNRFGNKAPKLNLNENLINDLKSAKTIEEAMEVREKIYEDLENQIPKTVRDVINSWRYLSMLGNPRTHIRNIVGNGVFAPTIDIKNVIGTILEGIAGDKLEYKTKAILNPGSSADNQLLQLGNEAYEKYRGAMEQGQKYETKSFSENTKLGKILNKLSDFNSQALDKEDFFFSKRRYASSYAQFLKANNLTADTLTSEMAKRANEYALLEAQKATYRDANSVAEWLNKLETSNKKGMRFASYIKDAIMPFTKTPMNIVKRGIEYSPVGLLKTIVYDSKQLADGKINANQYIDNMASGLTGTGIALLGALLSSMGLFRTKDDDKDRKQYFDKEKGEQDYAIDLSPFGVNGTYTIDWASPVIMPFAIGSELFNVFKDFEGVENFEGVINAVADVSAKIMDPIMETSMLSSLQDALKSYSTSGGAWLGDMIWSMTSSYIQQMFPTLGGQIARTMDDTRRTTSPNGGKIDKLLKQIYNKIPWMSKVNQPYINRQGQEEKTEDLGMGWLGRAVLNMASPGYYSSKDIDDYDEELYRLHDSTGSYDAFPSGTTKQIEFEGEKYKFTPEQYTQWHQTRWQTETEYVNQFIDSSAYERLSDEERVDTIKDIRDYAQKIAKKQFLESQGYEYTDDKELAESDSKYIYDKQLTGAQGAVDNNIELYAYFDYLNNSGSKQAEKVKYLEESNLTQGQKEYLWSLNDYKKSYEDVYKKVFGGGGSSSSGKKKSSKGSKKSSNKGSKKAKKVSTAGVGSTSIKKGGSVKMASPQRVVANPNNRQNSRLVNSYLNAYSASFSRGKGKPSTGGSSKVVCPKCGNKVSSASGRCPVCGTKL